MIRRPDLIGHAGPHGWSAKTARRGVPSALSVMVPSRRGMTAQSPGPAAAQVEPGLAARAVRRWAR
jgi:hypothetical protein